jgi:hypothetical protein
MAYWRNDRPGGIGTGFNFEDDPVEGVNYCRGLLRGLHVYDANATPADIIDQLREFGEIKESRVGKDLPDIETRLVAVANIYWLQERGHLAKDDHNGVIWFWTRGREMISSEQNPLTLDANAVTGIDVTEIALLPGSEAAFKTIADYARKLGENPASTRASSPLLSTGESRFGVGGKSAPRDHLDEETRAGKKRQPS